MKHQQISYTDDFKEHLDWVMGVNDDNKPIWERSGITRVVSMAAGVVKPFSEVAG